MRISGIYQIKSIVKPNKIYIGSTINIQNRWWIHLCNLRLGKHNNKILQNHYNKYGESDLIFSVLLECNEEDLIKNEQYYIDLLNPYFNICSKAASRLGVAHSQETKDKIRKANLGKTLSEEHKKKIGKAGHGRVLSSETRIKMSIAKKGRIITEEHRMKISKGNLGKCRTDEVKQKMSLAAMGNKNGKYLKGFVCSEERKQQMREVWVIRKLNKKRKHEGINN